MKNILRKVQSVINNNVSKLRNNKGANILFPESHPRMVYLSITLNLKK
jgi:5'(3')-deoxyribonucleotidase